MHDRAILQKLLPLRRVAHARQEYCQGAEPFSGVAVSIERRHKIHKTDALAVLDKYFSHSTLYNPVNDADSAGFQAIEKLLQARAADISAHGNSHALLVDDFDLRPKTTEQK